MTDSPAIRIDCQNLVLIVDLENVPNTPKPNTTRQAMAIFVTAGIVPQDQK